MHTARERRLAASRSPAPPLLDPRRDRLRVSTGRAAKARGLPGERFIELALAGTLEDPRHVGQKITAPGGELAQLPHRGGLLGLAQLTPAGVMLRLSVQLHDKHPV
jgi:hypothetical protein